MMYYFIKVCALIFILLFGNNSFTRAQNQKKWADSILNEIPNDQSKDYDLSKKYLDTLISIYQGNNNYCDEINCLVYQSYYFSQFGEYKKSLRCAFLANQKYQLHPCFNTTLLSQIYLAYASLYLNISENAKANYYVKKGIEVWDPKWQNKQPLIRLYNLKGSLFDKLSMQLYYYNLAYNLALESKDVKLQEYTLSNIGYAFAINEQFDSSEFYLRKALQLALNRQAFGALSSIYNNLAGLSQNPNKTLNYVDSSVYYASLSGSNEDLLIAYQNKALWHYEKGEFKNGYDLLWQSFLLKDSLFGEQKLKAFAEMEQRFESEKKNIKINLLEGENEIAKLKAARNLGINFSLAGALLGILSVALAFYHLSKKRKILNEELIIEKQKSDDLLLNILPEEVAEELKSSGKSEAKLYNQVTVLFTDFVNFTGLSEQMSPTELVQEIHKNFTQFDAIIDKHGLEKIKTIGDAYLAVCGLPHASEDHAIRVAAAALDIQKFMATNHGKFQIRIGIHSGPVVAGIVGVKKYAYDIWGDTVNTAARMEQNSIAGKINISGATHQLIKDHFNCEYRGKINAKNKGEVDMYFVNRSFSEG
jgi:adenylate cyclase